MTYFHLEGSLVNHVGLVLPCAYANTLGHAEGLGDAERFVGVVKEALQVGDEEGHADGYMGG